MVEVVSGVDSRPETCVYSVDDSTFTYAFLLSVLRLRTWCFVPWGWTGINRSRCIGLIKARYAYRYLPGGCLQSTEYTSPAGGLLSTVSHFRSSTLRTLPQQLPHRCPNLANS